MQGVTAALVAFIFVCVAMPSLVKHKNQFYIGLICVLFIIFLDAVAHMFPETALSIKAVIYVLTGFVQIIAIAVLVTAAGGGSFGQLKDGMFEVMRRGETEKEIIIPLSEEAKKIKAAREEAQKHPRPEAPQVHKIDDPASKSPPPPPPPKPPIQSGPLPLE